MTYITEEEVELMFIKSGGLYDFLRSHSGYFYMRRDNIIAPIATAYSESGMQPKLETYVVKSKNDIVKDILNDL